MKIILKEIIYFGSAFFNSSPVLSKALPKMEKILFQDLRLNSFLLQV